MPANRENAETLAERLMQFREELPAEQQQALDHLLLSFAEQVANSVDIRRHPPSGEQLLETSGVASVQEVRDLVREAKDRAQGGAVAIGPTITITTITTTVASHPIITCGPDTDVPIFETLTVKVGCEAAPH